MIESMKPVGYTKTTPTICFDSNRQITSTTSESRCAEFILCLLQGVPDRSGASVGQLRWGLFDHNGTYYLLNIRQGGDQIRIER